MSHVPLARPVPIQFNSVAVSKEAYSEPAINCVWHSKGGIVNFSLEYLVLVEMCTHNILFVCGLLQVKKEKKTLHQEKIIVSWSYG